MIQTISVGCCTLSLQELLQTDSINWTEKNGYVRLFIVFFWVSLMST